jgi:histidinol-phosphate phosphatase family protein
MSLETYETDAAVIGAGAVGLACAAALAARGLAPLVLERTGAIGQGVSSRNSEVVHAGIYYPTGSLKHRLCIEGRRRLYAYLAERRISHRVCGKWIVATNDAETAAIEAIYARALENGVENMRRVSAAALAEEPALACTAAIESLETGVFDSHAYMLALQGDIEAAGGAIVYESRVARGEVLSDGRFALDIEGPNPARLIVRTLINAAGFHAQAFARALSGYDEALVPALYLAKGSYFGCAGRPAFSRLIYPAPVDGGLGVHVTLDLAGRMRFGPDVEWLTHNDPDAVDYNVDIARSESFYAAIRRYWPGLPDGALTPDYSGCRPKLAPAGAPAADFRIDGPNVHGHAGLVHLFGIESPGLTASLAIADRAADEALGAAAAARRNLRRAVFFDRDGTLNHDEGYTHRAEDLVWNPGAIEAVRLANEAGYLAIVATNPSGIGRGLFDEAAMHAFHARMKRDLEAAGARLDAIYFCPYVPEATHPDYRHPDHPDRKPNPGMLKRAIEELAIDPLRSVMIGNSPDDLAAARAAGIAGHLYQGGDLAALLRRALNL